MTKDAPFGSGAELAHAYKLERERFFRLQLESDGKFIQAWSQHRNRGVVAAFRHKRATHLPLTLTTPNT